MPAGMDMMAPSGSAVAAREPAPEAQGLEEDTMDDVPFADEPYGQPSQQGGGQVQRQNQVSVQTSSQPVLVIPMSIGTSASTELIPPPMPGAPATLAVDTSARAMSSLNLQPSHEPRSRSNSGSKRFSGGGAPGSVVTVKREGASAPTQSNANVRVSVTKQG